jgi:hypothetical protein
VRVETSEHTAPPYLELSMLGFPLGVGAMADDVCGRRAVRGEVVLL